MADGAWTPYSGETRRRCKAGTLDAEGASNRARAAVLAAEWKAHRRGEDFGELVRLSDKLLRGVAKRFGRRLDPADGYQEGILGLARAADLFDPEAGAGFFTFAAFHVYEAVKRAVVGQGLSGSMSMAGTLMSLEKAMASTGCDLEEAIVELRRTGKTHRTVEALRAAYFGCHGRVATLYVGKDGDHHDLLDGFSDGTTEEDFIGAPDMEDRRRLLAVAMERLNPVQREIFQRAFLSEKKQSFVSLGKEKGRSAERVRQRAMAAMKEVIAGIDELRTSGDRLDLPLAGWKEAFEEARAVSAKPRVKEKAGRSPERAPSSVQSALLGMVPVPGEKKLSA
ncbi:hypothetical protein WV31_10555 [Magnetospirillum sp. ME-1]|uniref:sigma-70 family RNA polymerase sigma factor n=1 Tax=Magnetospirillum sp. ME-1 TaxID=1639348 RepID=UPI000A17D0E9|nr:sigma-70 family RNA polymerase sigma factor [Magnetospirillum sp. ME-1]ARJ66068.1 hypothetical protein WV31_10555 [Magnetospirillum sp. ME-1]